MTEIQEGSKVARDQALLRRARVLVREAGELKRPRPFDFDTNYEYAPPGTAAFVNTCSTLIPALAATVEQLAALSSEDATRPTPECERCHGTGIIGNGSVSECQDCDGQGRDATRPTGDKEKAAPKDGLS